MSDICLLVSNASKGAEPGKLMTGYEWEFYCEKARSVGIPPSQLKLEAISSEKFQSPTPEQFDDTRARLNARGYDLIIPLDDLSLNFTTGKLGMYKWHLSPLDALPGFHARKVIPTWHASHIYKQWNLGFYVKFALARAKHYNTPGPWERTPKNFLLNPGYDQSIAVLESIRHHEWHSLDLETGRGQINTFGVAWSPQDAIAIKVLPGDYEPKAFKHMMNLIAEICESDSKKIAQNGMYERMYLSRYGIYVNNFTHDTQLAMRLLYPEFRVGLANVGRIYTMEPYWKDDGREADSEDTQKDWGNIRDWTKHFDYNCKDTSGTLSAAMSQIDDLHARGLYDFYNGYVRELFDITYEMSATGFPLNKEAQAKLLSEYEKKAADLAASLSVKINHRSSKQKLKLLSDKGYKLPTKKDKESGESKDTADQLALKKLRLKHPEDQDLKALLEISEVEKLLSSYLRVKTFDDNRIRFSLNAFGTKSGRMSCTLDPWERGFNAQTMNEVPKSMIEWPEADDRIFIEVDLSQAESRFVAYDAMEDTLLRMLENKEDVHSYVAAEIYKVPMSQVIAEHKAGNSGKRQLGKKSGHGANYSMGPMTFLDSCLKEMDLVLTKSEATNALESYHRAFPKIRKWHERIKSEVYTKRRLDNPFGQVRYFYGRMDDNTFRDAYSWRPQSSVPYIANQLLLYLQAKRTEGAVSFVAHCQTHDSITLSCRSRDLEPIAGIAKNTDLWHPKIILPAGRLVIPTDIKAGRNLGNLTKFDI